MGTMSSNPEFFPSEKDLNTKSSMECNSFSARHEEEIKKEEDDQCRELLVSRALEIKLPCFTLGEEFKKNDGTEEDHQQADGYTTPRSMDHKLPLIFACPPAPRKPKSIPRKRKAGLGCRRSILITDLSTENIEALYSPAVLHGLAVADLGGIIKKVKNI